VECLTLSAAGGDAEAAFRADGLPAETNRYVGIPLLGHGALRRARGFRAQVVHAHDASMARRARRLAHALRVPCVVTVNRRLGPKDRLPPDMQSTALVAVSDAVRAELIQSQRIPRQTVSVIPNGVDLSRYVRPEPEASPDLGTAAAEAGATPVVGTFGRLIPEKGQAAFLRAAALVHAKRPQVEFLVMGSGPDLARLRRLADELGVDRRVTFAPGASFASMGAGRSAAPQEALYLRDLDVFVEPSTQEGLGLSVIQAMAWARPVVACGVGGLYSLIEDGVSGLLVPKEDPQTMAESILSLLDDPVRAADMGARARERIAAAFNIRDVADKHRRLYQELAGAGRQGDT